MNTNTIDSYFGVTLESSVISQKGSTLAVLLPGMGYTQDRALLDFSKKLCIQYGYDVLPIEYGFQKNNSKISLKEVRDKFEIVVDECSKLLNISLNSQYKRILFIGKSIGTAVQNCLCNNIDSSYDVKNIYLTPVDETIKLGIKENSLVISGSSDPLLSKENFEKLQDMKNIEFMCIDKGDHSLNIKGDVINSIENLKMIIEAEKSFLDKIS